MNVALELIGDSGPVLWRSVDRLPFSIGSNADCGLCIPSSEIDPVHLLMRMQDGALYLYNCSENGVRVDDEVIQDSYQLADGDLIQLGLLRAKVHLEIQDASSGGGRTRTLVSGTAGATGTMFRAVLLGEGDDKILRLDEAGLTFGSDPGCGHILEDPYISGFHAHLYIEGGRCMVRDLESRNGLYVDGRKTGNAEVAAGSIIKLGETELRIESYTAADTAPVGSSKLVGSSPQMNAVRQMIARAAKNNAPVLITGETGTGKEVVAALLRESSARSDGPFIALNCGSFGSHLIASELFGHERGAFTGAHQRRLGAFESAHGGTLFLDELGEMPLELQPQLLRAVELGEFRRVGGNEVLNADIRLVAATNRDLHAEVASGGFREDLYHRINVLTIELPTLRSRPGDIDELAHHFLALLRPAGIALTLDDGAFAKLRKHSWPGNIRELRNVIQRAILLRQGEVISAEDINFTTSSSEDSMQPQGENGVVIEDDRTLAEVERDAIMAALDRFGGNRSEAAVALGVARSTIIRKLDTYAKAALS